MKKLTQGYGKFARQLYPVCLMLGLICAGQAQQNGNSTGAKQNQTTSGPATANPSAEKKISAEEAEKLFREVDVIMKFASEDSGLPIKHPVKRRLTSRDELVGYMTKHMAEDKDSQRLRRSELVLKKFGLLPHQFDLQKFLVALLREQVAGYYDPKTETVNLLDWVDVEQQRAVLAHELTHALQDQSFGLEKWMEAGETDLDSKKKITADDLRADEISTVRDAVVEGQAMAVLVDYMLKPMGTSLAKAPQVVAGVKEGMLNGTPDSVVFHAAPMFLKEALTFPYRYGLDFTTALLVAGGAPRAFASVLANPPQNTRQIMEPQTYLSGEKIEPMPVPDLDEIFKSYDRFDVGSIGEFDVAVLLNQYAGSETSGAMFPHWRGGYYYSGTSKKNPAAPLALLYLSRWADAGQASRFAALYAKGLAGRYSEVRSDDVATSERGSLAPATLTGKHSWMTNEGPVVIEVNNKLVLVTESVDEPTTQELEKQFFGTPAMAAVPVH